MYRWRTPDGYHYPNSAWRLGFIGGYEFEDNGARNLDAYSGFFFYATGVTNPRYGYPYNGFRVLRSHAGS
jgi:hypothetical protein